MATYFHGNSEIQSAASGPDRLQTLVLMNHTGYIPYTTDTPPTPPSGNIVFLNSAAASLAHHHHHYHAPPPQQAQHFAAGGDMAAAAFHHGFLPQRVHYNLWTPPQETPSPSARDAPRAGTPLQQGLSLTLSSQQLGLGSGDDARAASAVSSGGVQSALLSSKYLKAAQELLEEVVHVGAAEAGRKSGSGSNKAVGESSGEGGGKRTAAAAAAAELTPAERQEVQMKKAKLISMLDEVEQRYRQYQQQMEIVMRWFEQAAGMGSARTYTALALHTISKQFRCLKDSIAAQIGGDQEPRLKLVDHHHLRHHRSLQQLGMIHHHNNAWRPQRGLPERSVSVLRSWLFEHFLHPYPKDSDKHMLAKQTGLTRGQVSNWFINARVRLWKPMVEEMYLEEIKDQHEHKPDDDDSKLSKDKPSTPVDDAVPAGQRFTGMSMSMSIPTPSELDGIAAGSSPKKARCSGDGDASHSPNGHVAIDVKPAKSNDSSSQVSVGRDGYAFMGGQTNFVGGFGQYPIAEIGRPFEADQFAPRYSSGGGSNGVVSLTLGLPHCDPQHHHHHHLSLAGGAHHQGFMLAGQAVQLGGGRRIDHHHMGEVADHQFGAINASPHPHSSSAAAVAFQGINIQNPKRFAAQLLPDYVA